MQSTARVTGLLFLVVSTGIGCGGGVETGETGTGGSGVVLDGTGGEPGTGTAGHSGVGSGGTLGSGGATATGGVSGTGGAVGTGGLTGTGGAVATGGVGGATSTGGAGAGENGAAGAAGGHGAGAGGAASGGHGGGGAGGAATTGAAGKGGGGGSGGATAGASGGAPSVCPAGITQTITVAKSGGQFATVQAAINSIASGSTTHVRINIKAGTYTEKLTINSRSNLCLVGDDATTTILSYGDSSATVNSTSGSASVALGANDFSAANLTFQNSYGSGSQAVALNATGQREQFLNCRFVGYQDTLYTHSGSQYFKDCYVQGNTDYVFGGATAVFDNCEARNVEGGSAVTAPNTDISIPYGIVFLGGKLTAASGVATNSVALGRPWGADGAATYLHVALGAHIVAAGFVAMSSNEPQNARFHEYQSTGSGANASARSSYQLSASQAASYTIANILPGWTPSYSQ